MSANDRCSSPSLFPKALLLLTPGNSIENASKKSGGEWEWSSLVALSKYCLQLNYSPPCSLYMNTKLTVCVSTFIRAA